MDYRTILPIGQNDATSCWAAALSWWLRALGRQPPSTQNDLLVEFAPMAGEDGTVTMDGFTKIAATPRFDMQLATFDIDGIQQMRDTGMLPITNTPNLIIWNRFIVGPGLIGLHLNAVFDQKQGADGSYIVTCMEPDFPESAPDGKRTGQLVDRPVSFFLNVSPLTIGCAN